VDEEIVDNADHYFWGCIHSKQFAPALKLGGRHVKRFNTPDLPPVLPFGAWGKRGARYPSRVMTCEDITLGPPHSHLRRDFLRDFIIEELSVPHIGVVVRVQLDKIFRTIGATSRAWKTMMRVALFCPYTAFDVVV